MTVTVWVGLFSILISTLPVVGVGLGDGVGVGVGVGVGLGDGDGLGDGEGLGDGVGDGGKQESTSFTNT